MDAQPPRGAFLWLVALGLAGSLASHPLRASGADALLFSAPAGAGRRSGSLTSCDDERCQLDRQAVPLAELIWIGLGVGSEPPPAGTPARGVVLADGTFRPGRFVGLSLGSVLLDTGSLDRGLVRWVHVADAPPPVDVLVRRDGGLRTGSLAGCVAQSCTMEGESSARADLAWIGLGVSAEAIAVPAAPQDPQRDLARFTDGTSRVTPLVGVSAGEVVLGAGSYPRGDVAWLYLAAPAPAPAGGPVHSPSSPASPGSPQGPAAPHSTPPAERPPSDRTPPAPPAGGPGERGALWTGTLTARAYGTVDDVYSEWNVTVDVRLREYSIPLDCWSGTARRAPRVGTLIRLLPEGSIVTNSFRCSGPYVSCSGGGSVTVTVGEGDDGIGQPAAIYLKTSDVDTSECIGLDPPVGGGQYFLGVGTRSSDTFPVTWVSSTGTSTEPSGFLSLVAGWSPLLPTIDCADREVRTLESGGVMRGSYSGPCTGCCPTIEVSWSVCREGAACPPPPPLPAGGPPPDADPCGDLARDRAQVDVLWDQRQAFATDLEAEWHRLEQAQGAMLDDVEAYRAAIDACAIWDIVGEALESWGDWGGEFPEFVTKVLSGDLSAFVGDDTWGPLAERAWAAFPRESTWAGNMHDHISGCGAPIPPDLRAAAHRFVDNWERVRGLMPSVQEKLNRIRNQDLRYWEEWHRFYQTCLQWAACKGVPPTECPRPPEQPSGPMPPAPPPAG